MVERAVIEITGTGIVSSWDQAAVLLYGYPAEQIVGHPADVLCPPAGRAREAAVRQRIIAGGPAERYEADRVRKDGTTVRVSVTAGPITSPAGVIVGVTVVSWKASPPPGTQHPAGAGTGAGRTLS